MILYNTKVQQIPLLDWPTANDIITYSSSKLPFLKFCATKHIVRFLRLFDVSIRTLVAPIAALILLYFGPLGPAKAACSIPNTLLNGQTTDASRVMDNFAAVADCAGAALLPSGEPESGNLAVFGGPQTITGGDLSGDCSTSGTTTVNCRRASSSEFGVAKVDGVTITDNGNGVISAVGGLPTLLTSSNNFGNASTSAFAFKGITFTCVQGMRFTALWFQQMTFASGGSYNAVIVRISGPGPNNITTTEEPHFGTAYVAPSSLSAASIRISFAEPVVMVPGASYAIMLGRTDAGGTFALPIQAPGVGSNAALLLGNIHYFARVASTSVPIGTPVDTNSGGSPALLMGYEYQPL